MLSPVAKVIEDETQDELYARLYPGTEFWFRYEDMSVGEGYTDHSGDYVFTGSRCEVRLWRHQVVRRTSKGAWVHRYVGFMPNGQFPTFADIRPHVVFVNLGAAKRFAAPTKDEAWVSFKARKARQKSFLEGKLRHVNQALAAERSTEMEETFP